MIDAKRWTANEREVVTTALNYYGESLRKRQGNAKSPMVKSDCQWRRVVIAQSLESIRDR